MDIPRVLVPVAPGVTSALGLLVADLRHDFARTVLRPGTDISPRELTYWFELMERQALEQMAREGATPDRVTLARTVDARYVGQGYELQVPAAAGEFAQRDVDEITERLHEAHERSYGYAIRDNAVEVVNVRVTAIAAMPRPDLVRRAPKADGDASRAQTGTPPRLLPQGACRDAHIRPHPSQPRRLAGRPGHSRAARLHHSRLAQPGPPPWTPH